MFYYYRNHLNSKNASSDVLKNVLLYLKLANKNIRKPRKESKDGKV